MSQGKMPAARDQNRAPKSPDKPSVLMRKYADDALIMLFALAEGAESEAVRVSAIKELLDRGFGKSSSLIGPDSQPVLTRIERVIVHAKN
jgi:hypothetical protein